MEIKNKENSNFKEYSLIVLVLNLFFRVYKFEFYKF
jgi:hypothetical protein